MDSLSYVSTLWAAVDVRRKAVAKTPWALYRRNSTGKNRQEVQRHPALVVWNQPNPFESRKQLIKNIKQHLDLTGKAFIFNAYGGMPWPVELYAVRPDRMRPIPSERRIIGGYEFTNANGSISKYTTQKIDFLRLPHPTDPLDGIGPVETLLTDLATNRLSSEWQRNFFANSATPGGILQFDERLEDHEFEEVQERMIEQNTGVNNAHRLLVLERAKWIDSAFSMDDLQFPELREASRDQILEALCTPKTLLGQSTEVNRASAESVEYIFSKYQTDESNEQLKEWLNMCFLPRFPGGETLEFDYVPQARDSLEDALKERDSNVANAVALIGAGADPKSVVEAFDLPEGIEFKKASEPVTAGTLGEE